MRALRPRNLGTSASISTVQIDEAKPTTIYQRFMTIMKNMTAKTQTTPTLKNSYEVKERLGSGRFGVVYKGVCRRSGMEVAIKNIPKRAMSSFNSATQEVNILQELKNSNSERQSQILNIINSYEDDEDVFIVSDLYTGGELFDHVVALGDETLSEKNGARIIKEILLAVQYLHSQNVTHRDLKPENICFKRTGSEPELVLVDFGNATKFKENDLLYEQTGPSLYVAPEVIKGDGYDHRADAWSVGVIMYITLTGEPPFEGETMQQIEENVLKSNYLLKGGIWDYISPSGKDLVGKLMCAEVEKRLTIDQALEHEWFSNVLKETMDVPSNVINTVKQSLRNFSDEGKLRRKMVQKLAEKVLFDWSKDSDDVRQLKNSFEHIYNSMDKNMDGRVSAVELGRALKKMNVVTSAEDLYWLTNKIGSCKNGFITFDEFFAAAASSKIVQLETDEDQLRNAFLYFDMNNSGKIDAADLHQMFGGNKKDAENLIKEYDMNGDGEIDYDEFQRMMQAV
jgi:calcium-dependent protein kinase